MRSRHVEWYMGSRTWMLVIMLAGLASGHVTAAPGDASADFVITISNPAPGGLAGDPFSVTARVTSTYQLARVAAAVEALQFDLAFAPTTNCSNCWTGTVT